MKTLQMVEQATDEQLRTAINDYIKNCASSKALRDLGECLEDANVNLAVGQRRKHTRKPDIELPFDRKITLERAKRLVVDRFAQSLGPKIINLVHRSERPMTVDQMVAALPREDFEKIVKPDTKKADMGMKSLIGAILTMAGMVQKSGRPAGFTKSGRYWEPHLHTMQWKEHDRIAHLEEMLSQLPAIVSIESKKLNEPPIEIKATPKYSSII